MNRLLLLLAAVLVVGAGVWFLASGREASQLEVGGVGGEESPGAHAGGQADTATSRAAAETRAARGETSRTTAGSPSATPGAAPGTGTLSVRVLWQEDKSPAAAVALTVTPARALFRAFCEPEHLTDGAGTVRVPGLAPGQWTVRAAHGVETTGEVKADLVCEVELMIPAGLTVDGVVVDGNGVAVPRAWVFLSQRWDPRLARQVGVTDEAGRFQLRALTKDHYVSARAEGFAPSCSHFFTGKPGDVVSARVVLPARGGSLRGVVLDRQGQPAPGAFVLLGPEDGAPGDRRADGAWTPGAPALRVRTGKDGRFEAAGLPAGEVAVQARAPGHAPWSGSATVPVGSFVELRIALAAGATLTGTVRDGEGKPVGGALIQAEALDRFAGNAVSATPEGAYRLGDLPAREVELTATAVRVGRDTTRLVFGPGTVYSWDPVLRQGLEIRGRVVDDRGGAVVGWRVVAQEGGEAGQRTFVAVSRREDGSFAITVPADQGYRVMVFEPGDWRRFPRVMLDDVRPGAESLLLQVPALGASTATIVGVLEAAGGTPLADPQLQIWHETLRLWRVLDLPAAGGPFELQGIPPGRLAIDLRDRKHPWLRIGERQAVAGAQLDLGTLRLQEPGTFAGTVTRRDGQPLEGLNWAVTGDDHREACVVTVTGNTYRSGPLAEGTYQLLVMGDWVQSFTREVTVRAGQEARLDVELQPALLRRVRITAPAGTELPRWLWVGLVDDKGKVIWWRSLSRGKDGAAVGAISAPAGTYRVLVQREQAIVAESTVVFGPGGEDTVELTIKGAR